MLRKINNILVFSFFVLGVFFVQPHFTHAQVLQEEERTQLRAELADLEKEIAAKEAELAQQQQQSGGIKKDLTVLKTQIDAAKLKIRQKNLAIDKLNKDIGQKKTTITKLEGEIDRERDSLAQLIRKTNETDDKTSLVYLLLSSQKISEFYSDVNDFASVKESVKQSVDRIKGVKTTTEVEKKTLEQKQDQEVDAKVELESQKKKVEVSEKEKQTLLSISKQKETEYQKYIADKNKRRQDILARLFSLRDTGSIQFGQALEFANIASRKTGVRPAFILAVITQESNLGKNTGSCYLSNTTTGAGINSKTKTAIKNVMKPGRDVEPFMDITKAVGRDPFNTLVSCPIAGGGYGGGMGPAQFIPSTWAVMKTRIAAAIGHNDPDPWNGGDAIMASAVYLADLGADEGTYTAERNAACRYYSGRKCDSKKPANTFYGNSVTALAKKIQETMIDPLQN